MSEHQPDSPRWPCRAHGQLHPHTRRQTTQAVARPGQPSSHGESAWSHHTVAASNYVLGSGMVSGVSPWRTAEGADGECSSQNGLEEVAPSQSLRYDVCDHFCDLRLLFPPRMSMSCPSTSPTHPGGHGELRRLPRPPRSCGGAPFCAGEEESRPPCVSPRPVT